MNGHFLRFAYIIWTLHSIVQCVLALDKYEDSEVNNLYHIYPTPPVGQDMTQSQFLSGV